MKRVLVHWVEIRTYEFPDDAPVNDDEELRDYVENHSEAQGDWDFFCIHEESRDWEIVQ